MFVGGQRLVIPSNNGLTSEQNQLILKGISQFKVNDLYNLSAAIGWKKRGPKSEQQKTLRDAMDNPQLAPRLFEVVVNIFSNNDQQMQSGRNRGSAPPRHQPYNTQHRGAQNNHGMNGYHQQQNPFFNQSISHYSAPQLQHQMTGKTFAAPFPIVPLPFYDEIAVIMKPIELPSIGNANKQTKQLTCSFDLTVDQMSKLQYRLDSAPMPRYELQVRFFNISDTSFPQKDDFPLNLQSRADDGVVQLPNIIPTNKPNAEPKRPSRPVNITHTITKFRAGNHNLWVEWTADKRTWAVGIYFVFRVNSDMLFKRLEENPTKHRSIELTRNEIINKLSGGEDDIAMDQLKTSLLDPLSKIRIKTPVRCSDCTHLQCFDLTSYLMMNERKPTWQCPVCSNYCPYNRLIVEDYFLDMLAKVDKNVTEIELKKDGSFDVIPDEVDVCLSDDDDYDIKPISTGAPSSSSATVPENGGKRKKPVTDDDIITLSDDEDENLSRGIQNSLNDIHFSDNTTAVGNPSQKPPQQKKQGGNSDIEYITLDDTPPRPSVSTAPVRQVSQQNHMASSSSSSANGQSPTGPQTIQSALAGIGNDSSSNRTSHSSQPSPMMNQQIPPSMQMNYPQGGYMNVATSTGNQTPTSPQYPYQPVYQMQGGMIGRNNQMAHMPQHHQPPNQQMMPQYGYSQMGNGFYVHQFQPQQQPPQQQYPQYRQN